MFRLKTHSLLPVLGTVCLFLSLLTPHSTAHAQSGPLTGLSLVELANGLNRPVDIANAGDERLFVAEQEGKVWIMNKSGELNPTPFMNIDSIAIMHFNPQGLLGLTFHPDYSSDPRVFVKYTDVDSNVIVASFEASSANPDIVDPTTYQKIITIPQPFRDHNGGDLNFGPDGYLYIATGDGGRNDAGEGDPFNNAQNPMSLLGKVLRIDINGGTPYSIPADNPYIGVGAALDEIWASGLRNPWRASFDPLTNDYWIADVGQDMAEEVNVQSASSTGGENYGWRCYEGVQLFDSVNSCSDSYIFPDFEYSHDPVNGGFSITGGYVYRGSANPDLYGKYMFCDYVTGNFWTMESDGGGGYTVDGPDQIVQWVVSFGEDNNGEIYCSALSGEIYLVQQTCSSTSRPYNLSSSLLSPSTINLRWSQLNNSNGYQLQGRQLGSPGLASLVSVSNNKTFSGLPLTTTFEWRARARCVDGTITDFSAFSLFTTGGAKIATLPTIDFGVSPNPAISSTNIYISGNDFTSEVLSLLDLSGQLIKLIELTGESTMVDLSEIPAGIYLLSDQHGNSKKLSILK